MKLKDTPLGTPEEFNVVIEIPKASPVKIEYDEDTDEMFEDFVFENGLTFISNYGFLPQTKAGDGDTLDVYVLSPNPIASGSVLLCRPIGAMAQLDNGEVDDKIFSVPVNDPVTNSIRDIGDVTEAQRQKFIIFYAEIAKQKKKTVEITGFENKATAIEIIKKSII